MTTLEMLKEIERSKVIYAILYRRAGVAFQFYEGDLTEEDFTRNLTVKAYYPTFSEAVNAEWELLGGQSTSELIGLKKASQER